MEQWKIEKAWKFWKVGNLNIWKTCKIWKVEKIERPWNHKSPKSSKACKEARTENEDTRIFAILELKEYSLGGFSTGLGMLSEESHSVVAHLPG